MSVFCRHNRFTADCAICSKGTVLEGGRTSARRPASGGSARPKAPAGAATRSFSGRFVNAGPYSDAEGSYEVRLERVPGGVRLAEWDGSGLRRRAPVLAAVDVRRLVEGAADVLDPPDAARLAAALQGAAGEVAPAEGAAPLGVSRGSSGDFKEELRVEPVGDGRVRIARWVLRPGTGWQLQQAPPMLPVARYAEALGDAVRNGVIAVPSDAEDSARLGR